jgi:hypothetical protein
VQGRSYTARLSAFPVKGHAILPRLSTSYATVKGTFLAYTHPSASDFMPSTKLIIVSSTRYTPKLVNKNKLTCAVRITRERIINFVLDTISDRLACLRHAASVHPEPGSNSQKRIDVNVFVHDQFWIPITIRLLKSFTLRTSHFAKAPRDCSKEQKNPAIVVGILSFSNGQV